MVRQKPLASQAAECHMPDLGRVSRGDAVVASHCSAGTHQAALPCSFTSPCSLGSLPQQEVSTCHLPHSFLFFLFLLSSHPPDGDASRAGGDPALPFCFPKGGYKWQRVSSADGRGCSVAMPLSCHGQVQDPACPTYLTLEWVPGGW